MKKIHNLLLLLVFLSFNSLAANYNFVIKKGDSLGKYFKQIGISQSLLINLIKNDANTKKLNNLVIGKKLKIITKNSKFKSIVYSYSSKYDLMVDLYKSKFYSRFVRNYKSNKAANDFKKYQFKITKNLFYNGEMAGLSIKQLQKINTEISVYINITKLRKNDIFQIFFKNNKLLAIKYFGKKTIQIFNWSGSFYNKNGKTVYDMFAKQPLKYKRISSVFTYNRYHPILKTNKPHRAVDYAANKGTIVRATANGKIIKKGYYGALGNMVEVKHFYGYTTIYAHLSKFSNIYKGKKVRNGQVLGLVGSTGRSTGNHLHYELKNGNKYFNPLTHSPKLRFQLKNRELQKFKKYIQQFN